MPGLRLRLKPVLATVILLTAIFLISGLTLQFAAPALSLPRILYQARYGLLILRLCLYISCTILWFSLYRRLPVQYRHRMKRVAFWSLVLLLISEISNRLQQENGI